MSKIATFFFVSFTQRCCGFSESKQPEPPNVGAISSRRSRPEASKQPPVAHESVSIDCSSVSTLPIVITAKDAAEAPILTLEVMESAVLSVGKKLQITALGLEGSTRGKTDGRIYVGSVEREAGEVVNDLILPQEDGIGRKHFVFKYNPATLSYYLRDLGDGSGTFIRVKSALALKQGYIVSFSDSHLLIQLDETNRESINIRFVEGPKATQNYSFTTADSPIRIGRMIDCCVRFEETGLSRYQCMISFIDNCWKLEDGDGRKGSTNGTWLYADDYFEVTEGMVFKAGQSLFSVRVT